MMDFDRAFDPRGLAGQTSSPMNAEDLDVPPGAPGYASGPLANPPPTPTPAPQSLTTLANGGTNHQTAWTSGQTAPVAANNQQPFASQEADLPPGAPGYAGGPLATTPRPSPTPKPDFLKQFSFSSPFSQAY